MTTDLRGLDLLDAAIDHIEKHPETWVQETYRCESGMCLAGWMAELAGGQWVGIPGSLHEECLVPEPGEDPSDDVHISVRAERLLGTSRYVGNGDLFFSGNTLDRIKAMRDDLRAGAA